MDAIDYSKIAKSLKEGAVLAYPTETVWGIGCDLEFSDSVERIFEIKGRENTKAMSVLIRDIYQARRLGEISAQVQRLMDIFWPGSVTFVLRAHNTVPLNVRGGSEFIGMRISSHPFVQELFKCFDGVLITTSANPSGKPSAMALEELAWLPKDVIKAPWSTRLNQSLASTVVKIDGSDLTLLRDGETKFDYIKLAAEKLGLKVH